MIEALGGRPLIVRTLDIGGDKQVPHLRLPVEDNPFLGVRGVRLLLRRPDLLRSAIARAVLRAAAGGPLSIMFPMVTAVPEVRAVRAALRARPRRSPARRRQLEVGIMVEVPAAALQADALARRGRLLLHRHQRPDAVRAGDGPGNPELAPRPTACTRRCCG